MGEERNIGCVPRPDIICIEGNGARPSHFGTGWYEGEVMYTLNSTEVHAVAYAVRSEEGTENDNSVGASSV